MKKNISKILFIIGLLIFLFPFAIRLISHFNQTRVVNNYLNTYEKLENSELENMKNESDDYNNKIADEDPVISMSGEVFNTENSISSYDFLKTGEAIGTLTIPKINVNLPIYDTLEESNLQKGVVHLADTSYPTGKSSTHCVLVGHSGITMTKILDDIDKLQIGDYFQINYLNENSNYEVTDIKTVLPDETESLKIQENETLVTLVTCIPKNVNTYRLLVTGKKVPFNDEKNVVYHNSLEKYYVLLIVIIVILIVIIIYLFFKKNKKKQ